MMQFNFCFKICALAPMRLIFSIFVFLRKIKNEDFIQLAERIYQSDPIP
jgi:hypothetical protein